MTRQSGNEDTHERPRVDDVEAPVPRRSREDRPDPESPPKSSRPPSKPGTKDTTDPEDGPPKIVPHVGSW